MVLSIIEHFWDFDAWHCTRFYSYYVNIEGSIPTWCVGFSLRNRTLINPVLPEKDYLKNITYFILSYIFIFIDLCTFYFFIYLFTDLTSTNLVWNFIYLYLCKQKYLTLIKSIILRLCCHYLLF